MEKETIPLCSTKLRRVINTHTRTFEFGEHSFDGNVCAWSENEFYNIKIGQNFSEFFGFENRIAKLRINKLIFVFRIRQEEGEKEQWELHTHTQTHHHKV